jgi:hypothetical protein
MNHMKKVTAIVVGLVILATLSTCKKNSGDSSGSGNERVIAGDFLENVGFHEICKTHDNNFAIVARKGPSQSLYVALLNSSLYVLWEKEYGSNVDHAGGIIESGDAGLIIASKRFVILKDSTGVYYCSYYLDILKVSSAGDSLWEKKYPFSVTSGGDYPLLKTSDGGIIISVSYPIADTLDYYPSLFKVDQQGDSLWLRSIPGEFGCFGTDIALTPDNGFLYSSLCSVSGTDSAGHLNWDSDQLSGASSVLALQDGTIAALVRAYTDRNIASLVLADPNGNKLWGKQLMEAWDMQLYHLYRTTNNGYAFMGKFDGVIKLVRTDNDGNKLSEINMNGYYSNGFTLFGEKFCCYLTRENPSTHKADLYVCLVE